MLGVFALEYQLAQNALISGVQEVNPLVAADLVGEREESTFGADFNRLFCIQLPKDHDGVGSIHHVANLIISLRQNRYATRAFSTKFTLYLSHNILRITPPIAGLTWPISRLDFG
jgi:hypothetical protein